IRITDAYTDTTSALTHVYARQTLNGMDVTNGLANINIDAQGRVISSSQSFAPAHLLNNSVLVSRSQISYANNLASLKFALKQLVSTVSANIDEETISDLAISTFKEPKTGAAATHELLYTSNKQVVPVWHICLQQDSHWWSANINTNSGRIESLNDWAYGIESYQVLPRTILSPADGLRQFITNPALKEASPNGWVTSNTTTGNNVWTQNNPNGGDNWINNHRPIVAQNAAFDFPFDNLTEPSGYVDYSITQLFYTVNMMHDLAFIYGFNEAAGNFQEINFTGQGSGGDFIVANAQDGSSKNNAMFFSPPDGQHGLMRMYVWNSTAPERDGSLEQDIVAHEFTHGISSRLTGGPSNADCLNDGEAAGMGEGWSDIVACILRIKPSDTRNLDLTLGEYVNGQNIRMFPYSTNLTTNPHMYQDLNKSNYKEVHNIGEVWASMLYEVLWNLIDVYGTISDIFAHKLDSGNAIMLQILLDGMKLQPCSPSFIDARNAIVQAERNLTGGKNQCDVWRGFAKRGLGLNASFTNLTHTEDYSVPNGC
ncbi:hypothetical protein COEREDRAFT_22042, partial [Coemansia reversa NRRL 1564]